MDSTPQEYNAVTLRQKFPCLNLLRAFRMALDIRRLLLGAFAVLFLSLGNWLIDQLPFAPDHANSVPTSATDEDGKVYEYIWKWDSRPVNPIPNNSLSFDQLFRASTSWKHPILGPVDDLLKPVMDILNVNSTLENWAYGWTRFFWALFVGVIVAGAICRQVAVEFATDQKISLGETFAFVKKYFVSFFFAPLLPVLGIGFLWLICLFAGWFGQIPGIGPLVIGALYFIALIFGFLMTLLFACFAIGFPLMIATVSTEASDSFDGFSRSMNYLYSRTLYYAGLIIFMLALATASLWIVSVAANWVTDMAEWGVSSGMGRENTDSLLKDSRKPKGIDITQLQLMKSLEGFVSDKDGLASNKEPAIESSVGTPFVTFWMSAFNLLLHGFVVSFFWTSATIIYFLLRKTDDGTGLNEVYWEESQEPDSPFPVVEADSENGDNLDDTVDASKDEGESESSGDETS